MLHAEVVSFKCLTMNGTGLHIGGSDITDPRMVSVDPHPTYVKAGFEVREQGGRQGKAEGRAAQHVSRAEGRTGQCSTS